MSTQRQRQRQRQRHMEEGPKVHGIPRGTGRIIPGMHNRGLQRTVESQRDKTQANDERPRRLPPGAAHLQTPIMHPKLPSRSKEYQKPQLHNPETNSNPSPQTIHAPQNLEPPTITPKAPSPFKAPSHTHEPHKTSGLIWQLSFKQLRYRIRIISGNQ